MLEEVCETIQSLEAQNIALRIELDSANRGRSRLQALLLQKLGEQKQCRCVQLLITPFPHSLTPSLSVVTFRCPSGAKVGQVCEELRSLRSTLRRVREKLTRQRKMAPLNSMFIP